MSDERRCTQRVRGVQVDQGVKENVPPDDQSDRRTAPPIGSTPDQDPTETGTPAPNEQWNPPISLQHALLLDRHAVRFEDALDCGVYSADTLDELPQELRWPSIERQLPAIVFPRRSPSGVETVRARLCGVQGNGPKYIAPKGSLQS